MEDCFYIRIKLFFPLYFNISNITINIKKMYNKKTLTFTFHHYWGAFCQGAFVLDPINHISDEILTTEWMIHSGTNSPPEEISTQ